MNDLVGLMGGLGLRGSEILFFPLYFCPYSASLFSLSFSKARDQLMEWQ